MTDIIDYMKGFSLLGFMLMILLRNIAAPATRTIIALGIVVVSLLTSAFIPLSLMKPDFRAFKQLIVSNVPVFITILMAIWTITINSIYFGKINEGNVAPEFHSLSFYSLIIIASQVYISFLSLTAFLDILSQKNETILKSQKTQKNMNTITYLITPLNVLLLTSMNVILAFFLTDD